MFCRTIVLSALCAIALSAPTLTYSASAVDRPVEMEILSDYFQMLGEKIQEGISMATAPVCDLNNAIMPVASPTPLPAVAAGLSLKHVAIGRGTQNYSCTTSNQTAAPVAIGALATLYNASCIASTYPDLLAAMPIVALQFNLTSTDQPSLTPSNLAISGHHYFQNSTTPTFNLNTTNMDLGFVPSLKNNSVTAPVTAPKGQYDVGHGAVAWLKLLARDDAEGNVEEVYRVNTAGGNPPDTCEGMAETFEVQYAAEYWFYQK